MSDIWDKDNPDGIWSALSQLESELGLPAELCDKFRSEDDWSFVIKLHALLEAALTNLLTSHIGEPGLRDIISRLEMSGVTTGKLAFAKALNLLEGDERDFIKYLSELRNQLVHNIKNVTFDLTKYLEATSKVEQNRYFKAIRFQSRVDRAISGKTLDDTTRKALEGFLISSAKDQIWRQGMFVLAFIQLRTTSVRLKHDEIRATAVRYRKLMNQVTSLAGLSAIGTS